MERLVEVGCAIKHTSHIPHIWKAFHEATGVHPSSIEGAELLDEAYHKALLDANEDERYEEADC